MTEVEPPSRRKTRSRSTRVLVIVLVALVFVLGVVAIAVAVSGGGDAGETTVDTFHRADNRSELGSASDGPQWSAVLGTWGISNDAAVVTRADAATNVAIAPLSSSNGTVEVKVASVSSGAGLVFRYQNPSAYWELIAAPKFLTWQIYRIDQGRPKFVANTGAYSSIDDNTTLKVRTDGALIEVSVGGDVRKKLYDDYLANAAAAGMVASGKDATDASFSRFAFTSP